VLSFLAPLLALGLTINAEPGQVIVFAVLLGGSRPRANAAAFVCGWLLSLAVVFGFAGTLVHLVPVGGSATRARAVYLGELLVALALLAVAAIEWKRRDRPRRPDPPRWLARLDDVRPGTALLLGLWEQPWTVTIAAGIVVLRAQVGLIAAVAGFAVFAAASTLSLALTYAYFARDPAHSAERMRRLEARIAGSGPRVFGVAAAVLALLLAADALHGLTRA
jgi:hypothetical protein